MRRRALAIQLASLTILCATAGLPSSAAGGETVAHPVGLSTIERPRFQSASVLRFSAIAEREAGVLHCWASQQWHTGLLQEPEPSDGESSVDDTTSSSDELKTAETTSPDEGGLEFESYVADPNEAAKKGLSSRVAPPWYSAEEDQAVPVGLDKNQEPFRDPIDPGNRESDWVRTPTTTTGNWWSNWAPFSGLPLTELIWVALVLAAVLLGGLLIFALIKSRIGENQGGAGEEVAEEEEDPLAAQERIERLPFELRQGVVDFLEEARRLAASGKYEEALVYLFSHALVQLDRANRIRLAKGKTNRQYVSEISSSPPLAQLLSELADDFEGVFFGKYRLSQANYERNLDRIERFRNLLQQASHG